MFPADLSAASLFYIRRTVSLNVDFESKLSMARSLAAAGSCGRAEALYKELLESGKETEGLLRELAHLYISTQRPDSAIKSLEQLTQIAPDNLNYTLTLAKLYERAGCLDKCIHSYRNVLEKQPNVPNIHYNLAIVLKKSGRYQEAIQSYEKALAFNISQPEEVYCNLSVIYSELHREAEALIQLDKAIEANPNYIPALFNMAGLLEEAGKKQEAVDKYKQILCLDGRYYPALCRLANIQSIHTEQDALVAKITRALEDRNLDSLAREELHFALGKLMNDCGLYDRAFQSYRSGNEVGKRRFSPYSKERQEEITSRIMHQFDCNWFSRTHSESECEPIFICGMFRSGSTLAEQILSGHSRVTAGGELSFFPDLVRSLAQKYPGQLGEYADSFFNGIAGDYFSFLRERFGNFSMVTDKRPDNFLHLGLIKSVFPKSRIIWTTRNLFDNCLSIYFLQLGGGMNYSVDLDSIGHYYTQQVRLMQHWRSLFPDTFFELPYDQLVKSPGQEVAKLLRFLNLEWEDSCLDFSARRNYVKTASIWQVRQSIYGGSVERYKHYQQYLQVLEKYQH